MTLLTKIEPDKITLKLLKNRRVIDIEKTKYYHDLSKVLTPLEVSAIKRKGFIKRDGTVIYGELLTGLITTLDKLLKRNNIDPIRLFCHTKAKHSKKAKSNGVGTTAISSFKIRGNIGKNSTSYKIAAAFIEGLKVRVYPVRS